MQNINKNIQKQWHGKKNPPKHETIKSPKIDTQKFDTNINQKMYKYSYRRIPMFTYFQLIFSNYFSPQL